LKFTSEQALDVNLDVSKNESLKHGRGKMTQLNRRRLRYQECRWRWTPQLPTWLPTQTSQC